MNYTNLNIKTTDKTFKYIVEYYDDPGVKTNGTSELKYYLNSFGYFLYGTENQSNALNVKYEKNYWQQVLRDDLLNGNQMNLFPNTYNISSFRLYFPRYSVETYNNNTQYILSLSTWINGVRIFLGSYLIDRRNAIASENGVRRFLNDDYYEYIKVDTVDPYYLLYGDEWKKFREIICKENIDAKTGSQKNNSACNIHVSLTPVKNIDGTWVKLDGYDSSQSTLLINTKQDSYMAPLVKFDNSEGQAQLKCAIKFNPVYDNNFDLYLKETYQIDFKQGHKITYELFVGNDTEAYKYVNHTYESAVSETTFDLEEFKFDSWKDYLDGLSAWVVVTITKNTDEVFIMSSNKVFLTKEVFKYLLEQPIRKIDLDKLDMTTNKFDVVNIINNEIVSVERPNEYNSNILKPIFIKVQEADKIRLHRNVTENIVINLDAYKNKVDVFVLKIGETNFYEIARVNSGIVFKVIGTNLPEEDGVYYIVNNEGELVTTGNYTIVS